MNTAVAGGVEVVVAAADVVRCVVVFFPRCEGVALFECTDQATGLDRTLSILSSSDSSDFDGSQHQHQHQHHSSLLLSIHCCCYKQQRSEEKKKKIEL